MIRQEQKENTNLKIYMSELGIFQGGMACITSLSLSLSNDYFLVIYCQPLSRVELIGDSSND